MLAKCCSVGDTASYLSFKGKERDICLPNTKRSLSPWCQALNLNRPENLKTDISLL
jgi:hypothetical protein